MLRKIITGFIALTLFSTLVLNVAAAPITTTPTNRLYTQTIVTQTAAPGTPMILRRLRRRFVDALEKAIAVAAAQAVVSAVVGANAPQSSASMNQGIEAAFDY